MDDPDIKATLDRILGNFEGIADDFLTELLEAEAFEKVLDGLLAVFLDPVMEHIVDDLVGKFADPNPDLIENPDAVPGHPLLGALLTNIMAVSYTHLERRGPVWLPFRQHFLKHCLAENRRSQTGEPRGPRDYICRVSFVHRRHPSAFPD